MIFVPLILQASVISVSSVVLPVISVYSCPFVVTRNQLDGEFRRTDKGSVGKGIDPEEGATYSSRVGPQNPPHAPWQKRIVQRIMRNRKMMRIFLIGALCGVIIAATFTYVFAIPANNYYWQSRHFSVGGWSPGALVGTAKDPCQPATVTTCTSSNGLTGFSERIGTTSPRVACVATK